MLDAVEYDLNRYLDKIDREELRENAITERMEQSMGAGEAYHPMNSLNFIEGLEEGNFALLKTACELLESGDFAGGGKLLHQISTDYWSGIARQDAVYEVDNPDEDDFDEPDREWP